MLHQPFGVFVIYLKIEIFSQHVVAAEIFDYGTGKENYFIIFSQWNVLMKNKQKSKLYIFSPKPGSNALKIIYELSVSNKPVNCFDWSPDRAGLAICSSFDKTLRIIASVNLPLGQ